ncbi:MAG TPA: response regulator transcription factor [Candidatus Fimivicinus intestinavium]|nr:response regulator transcription factor [Candidatus Fimivicinus intestinavium]
MRILLVEDDRAIAMGLVYALEQAGYTVRHEPDAAGGKKAAETEGFDLAILDLMLPDGSGYDVCRTLRARGETPVIFLTACDDEGNAVMGLEMGAEDYVTKPFRLRELLARIKNVLRRRERSDSEAIRLGEVTIYPSQARVLKAGQEVFLTALEYRLLLTFAVNAGQALTRGQLLESIWDAAGDFVNDNTLTVYIKRLREKLEDDPQNPRLIQTVRGIGYRACGAGPT